jgi:opacity protein-like surface antigen
MQFAVRMKLAKKVGVCLLFLMSPLLAQNHLVSGAPAAMTGPVYEASAGYTYIDMDTPSRQRTGLSGVDANGFVDFNAHLGMIVDVSYAHVGNVLSTPHSGSVLSCLTGPVFYPLEYGNTRIFVHTLAGASVVNSAVPVTGTYYLGGTIARFSYALGGGVEHTITGPFAIRIGADYLRTTFANASAALAFQNNFRIVTAIAYRFGSR